MGGPPAHIRSMRATGDRLLEWGVKTTSVVAADGVICLTEGQVMRHFRRRKEAGET